MRGRASILTGVFVAAVPRAHTVGDCCAVGERGGWGGLQPAASHHRPALVSRQDGLHAAACVSRGGASWAASCGGAHS